MCGGQRTAHVDKTLVRRASEQKGDIPLGKYERAVDEYVDKGKKFVKYLFGNLVYAVAQLLEGKPRVAPDIQAGFLDGTCQRNDCLGLVYGVSSGKSDVVLVVEDSLHDLVDGHVLSGLEVPRLLVVTPRATVAASGKIY